MISFASIIFRHPTFHRDAATYARLVKLVLFSSAVHQTVFVTTSSLVFAVGQVQDAGLIFLSSMANQVVEALEKRQARVAETRRAERSREEPRGGERRREEARGGERSREEPRWGDRHRCHRGALHSTAAPQAPYDEVIATALVALASSTTLLGLALVLTGKLRLAGLVQYLPLPVVGGYLAYIGLYCFEAGLSLMSGTEVTSVAQMVSLAGGAGILPCLPGVACGVGIILALQRCHHFLVLPSLLLAIPVLFYAAAFAAGLDLPALRAAGYLSEAEQPASCLETWSSFRPSLVHWDVLPSLLPTWLAMYTVVAFSSSLDVAAIQMDMGKQLDFNHELITVGLSNAASGLCGGFTGSYIFIINYYLNHHLNYYR